MAVQVNIAEAKRKLSSLLDQAPAGQDALFKPMSLSALGAATTQPASKSSGDFLFSLRACWTESIGSGSRRSKSHSNTPWPRQHFPHRCHVVTVDRVFTEYDVPVVW